MRPIAHTRRIFSSLMLISCLAAPQATEIWIVTLILGPRIILLSVVAPVYQLFYSGSSTLSTSNHKFALCAPKISVYLLFVPKFIDDNSCYFELHPHSFYC